MSKKESIEVTYKYKFSDDYNPVYANGVFGGIAPCGEIVMNFYQERPGLPHKQFDEIFPDGTKKELRDKRVPISKHEFVRFVENGTILSEGAARTIHEWLGAKLKELEEIKSQAKKENGNDK